MSQSAKAPEPKIPDPSIDEILASIRRSIVPEDDAGKPPARKPASRKPTAVPSAVSPAAGTKGRTDGEAMLRVDCDAAGRKENEKAVGGVDGHSPPAPQGWIDDERPHDTRDGPGDPAEAAAAPAIGMTGAAETDACEAVRDGPLLSPGTTAAVDTAFTSLAHTMLSQNPRTLEDLVRDMLKPMLKAWLDANLPDMVERLVRAEIERVSRRG